jgi:DNA (cytosine-5)-methyltransferase 1
MTTPTEILFSAYQQAIQMPETTLTIEQQNWVNTLIQAVESQKAVLTVVITSLVKKIETPAQDIRQHKVELPNGYSGRSYDTKYITFIRKHFPRYAMAESGWLTRSLEQVHAFTLDFPGKISQPSVKNAFLQILDDIETNQANPDAYLVALLTALQVMQQAQFVPPQAIVVSSSSRSVIHVYHLLQKHFYTTYNARGASRLPVIALYTIYELLMTHPRYVGKTLLPLKSHTTADSKSSGIGDIEIVDENSQFFEVLEIKHLKPIELNTVQIVYDKIRQYPVKRYYILTTAEPNIADEHDVILLINRIAQEHGCEIIPNGVMPSLKYYLRLLISVDEFIAQYTTRLIEQYEIGTNIKKVHVDKWLSLQTP